MNLPAVDEALGETQHGFRPLRHSYDVAPYTGRAIAIYPPAQWRRGRYLRGAPVGGRVSLPPMQPMPIPGGSVTSQVESRR